jgi:hypothetical protein
VAGPISARSAARNDATERWSIVEGPIDGGVQTLPCPSDAPHAFRSKQLHGIMLDVAQGIPRAAMSPAASGGRTVEPVTEEDF